MLRHIPQPLDAGGLEADVGVEAAGDGLVDDGLLLLFQHGTLTVQGRFDQSADRIRFYRARLVGLLDDGRGGLFAGCQRHLQ